jgi:AcrR family transcriptional regulator
MPRPATRNSTARSARSSASATDPTPPPEPGPSRRTSQKSENTRKRLLDAARTVFARVGFYDTRVADIADEAGVSHGTFYTHFVDKGDAFRAVVLASNDELNQEMLTVPAEVSHDLEGALTYSNRRFFDVFQQHAALHRAIAEANVLDPEFRKLRIAARQEHVEQVARTITRWQARGQADKSLDARHTAAALVCMMAEFASLAFAWDQDYDLDEMTSVATTMWLRTVGADSSSAKTSPRGTRRAKG